MDDKAFYGIDKRDVPAVLQVLRSTLYTDKILTILREYGSNAWDEHQACGKGDVPIQVTLPTQSAPVLRIRDFGRGLSPEGIFQTFVRYGRSTKRQSNTTVGCLGLGSKSAFCYSDNFTINSWHGGKKRTYLSLIDESELGQIRLVFEMDSDEPTGLEIRVPVKPADVSIFPAKAVEAFRFFTPTPKGVSVPPIPKTMSVFPLGTISANTEWRDDRWVAVMGCVGYKIDLKQLPIRDFAFLRRTGTVKLDIGAVSVAANREALEYTDETRAELLRAFTRLQNSVQESFAERIKTASSDFERRLIAWEMKKLTDLVEPTWGEEFVHVPDATEFTLYKSLKKKSRSVLCKTTAVWLQPGIKFVYRDNRKPIDGYLYGDFEVDKTYFIVPNKDLNPAQVKTALLKSFSEAGLSGASFAEASSLQWRGEDRGIPKENHRKEFFIWNPKGGYGNAASDHWRASEPPKKGEPFVLLKGFEPEDSYALNRAASLRRLFGHFDVYGVKVTAKNKYTEESFPEAVPLKQWLSDKARSLLASYDVEGARAYLATATLRDRGPWLQDVVLPILIAKLGKDHPLATSLVAFQRNKNAFQAIPEVLQMHINRLDNGDDLEALLKEKYPLAASYSADLFSAKHCAMWCEYIRLVDEKEVK